MQKKERAQRQEKERKKERKEKKGKEEKRRGTFWEKREVTGTSIKARFACGQGQPRTGLGSEGDTDSTTSTWACTTQAAAQQEGVLP